MISSINSLPESRRSLANGNGAREVKTTRPGDEAAPEQDGDGADVQLHSHERRKKELETMAITFRALDRGLKYIQDSLYVHIRRYSMIRVKHAEDERTKDEKESETGTKVKLLSEGASA